MPIVFIAQIFISSHAGSGALQVPIWVPTSSRPNCPAQNRGLARPWDRAGDVCAVTGCCSGNEQWTPARVGASGPAAAAAITPANAGAPPRGPVAPRPPPQAPCPRWRPRAYLSATTTASTRRGCARSSLRSPSTRASRSTCSRPLRSAAARATPSRWRATLRCTRSRGSRAPRWPTPSTVRARAAAQGRARGQAAGQAGAGAGRCGCAAGGTSLAGCRSHAAGGACLLHSSGRLLFWCSCSH
jgi:hypothetical protein